MKIFSMIHTLGDALFDNNDATPGDAWRQDPLSHPVLQAMSVRELADLPFNRGTRFADASGRCARC